jgi:hypothetical protein
LAYAHRWSGDKRYLDIGVASLYTLMDFVPDATQLWSAPYVLRQMADAGMREPYRVATQVPFRSHRWATFAIEKEDRDFRLVVFQKVPFRTPNPNVRASVKVIAPDGKVALDRKLDQPGLRRYELEVKKDGVAGRYRVEIDVDRIWAWTDERLVYELAAGSHSLVMTPREPDAQVDRIAFVPGKGVRAKALREQLPEGSIAFEAESARLGGTMKILEDGTASGGRYLAFEKGGDGEAKWQFDVKAAGTYRLFAKVWFSDSSHDSVFVSVDGGKPAIFTAVDRSDSPCSPEWSLASEDIPVEEGPER